MTAAASCLVAPRPAIRRCLKLGQEGRFVLRSITDLDARGVFVTGCAGKRANDQNATFRPVAKRLKEVFKKP